MRKSQSLGITVDDRELRPRNRMEGCEHAVSKERSKSEITAIGAIELTAIGAIELTPTATHSQASLLEPGHIAASLKSLPRRVFSTIPVTHQAIVKHDAL